MEVLTSLAVISSGCRVAQCSPFRYLQCNEGSTPREEARRACSWVCPFLEIPASDWPAQAPECAWSCVFDELCVLGASLVAQWQAACQWGSCGFDSWVGKVPWRKWPPIPIFLPGKSHEQRSPEGCSPWRCKRVWHNLVTDQPVCPRASARSQEYLLVLNRHREVSLVIGNHLCSAFSLS